MIDTQSSQAIDSTRVISCLVVVASHVFEFVTGNLNNPINETISYTAVAVFFFLSGYVNERSYRTKPNYLVFLKARAIRLLPTYYLAFLFSLGLAVFFQVVTDTDVFNLVFAQSIAVPTIQTNGPLWSLAWEVVLYLCFPVCLGIVRKPLLFIIPCMALFVLFHKHAWLLALFLAGIASSIHGFRFPPFRVVPFLGRYTYPVYCWHYPLMFAVFAFY